MTDTTTLIQRLSDEADLCRNDGATDIAKLLDDAVYALVNQAAQIAALRADAERLGAALANIAKLDHCRPLIDARTIARIALRQEEPK